MRGELPHYPCVLFRRRAFFVQPTLPYTDGFCAARTYPAAYPMEGVVRYQGFLRRQREETCQVTPRQRAGSNG